MLVGDLRLRFPEFADDASHSDARIQMIIDEATILMSTPEHWLCPDMYRIAQLNYVAHLLTLADMTAFGGGDSGGGYPIKEQHVDDVIIKNAVSDVSPLSSTLHSTLYGRTYYRYLRINFTGIIGV